MSTPEITETTPCQEPRPMLLEAPKRVDARRNDEKLLDGRPRAFAEAASRLRWRRSREGQWSVSARSTGISRTGRP